VSSYFIALINIHDDAGYREYLAGFDEIFQKYSGCVLAVEDQPRVLEGEWPARRTVLIRFPDDGALRRWYESPEYQHLARVRRGAAVASIAIVSGRDEPSRSADSPPAIRDLPDRT
jgi:uncharacterized protein (DUF1330 family)